MTSTTLKPTVVTKVKKGSSLHYIKGTLGYRSIAEKKELTEKENLKKRISRQKLLEVTEIKPQTWSFVFGDEIPKYKKEICRIDDITPRNLWMESLYIFNKIKALRPNEIFHSPESYALKWQPPGSSFRLSVPLVDIQVQENVIEQMAKLFPKTKDSDGKVLFYFSPRDSSLPLFAIKVHPSSLVSYRTNIAVLEKLCYFYIKKTFPLSELQEMLTCDYLTWRLALYSYLPPDEQVFHRYLQDRPEPILTLKKMESKYQKDEISLQDFSDFKFHERKERKDIEALTYPRPYKADDCIICHQLDVATIHCPNCANMVCKSCINRHFLEESTKIGSFISMHRLFCLQKHRVNDVEVSICKEPAYLADLRNNGRDITMINYRMKAELRALREAGENEILESMSESERTRMSASIVSIDTLSILQVPEELEVALQFISKLSRKYKKLKKSLLDIQVSIDMRGHTEPFLARLLRVKDDNIDALITTVQNQLDKATELLMEFNFSQDSPHILSVSAAVEVDQMMEDINFLSSIESVPAYHKKIENVRLEKERLQQMLRDQKIVSELLNYG